MERITEDMHLEKEWFKKAKCMTLETLPAYLNELMNYEHDYGTICHAIASGAIATMWAMNNHENGNITGFQASCLLWDIIKQWSYTGNTVGLKITDYNEMLYPQYEHKFEKTISHSVWGSMVSQAKENLMSEDFACEAVRNHWESIVNGEVPFGYKVVE